MNVLNDKERKEIGDKAYSKANRIGTKGCDLTIKDFSIDELKMFLVTCDGMGPRFKSEALSELIERVVEDTKQDVWNSYQAEGRDREFSERN